MKSPFHSLRWKLQAWHALVLLLVITGFCLAVHGLAWTHQLKRLDRAVVLRERELFGALLEANRPPAPPVQPPAGEAPAKPRHSPQYLHTLLEEGRLQVPAALLESFSGTEPGYSYFILCSLSSGREVRSPNLLGIPALPNVVPNGTVQDEFRTTDSGAREHVLISPTGAVLIVGRDATPERDEMRVFAWSLAAAGLATWLAGLLGGWWIAGRAIRPISQISATASRISEGNLRERIPPAEVDNELAALGRVLNNTFERLGASLEMQRQFTADASHELRTPVTILLNETQRMLKRERTPEEYQESLRLCEEATRRMRRLVEDLLVLARQEAATTLTEAATCDLAELARASVSQHRPLAEARRITIEEALTPSLCRGEPADLGILLNNLVSNAIHHQQDGGWVKVTCGTDEAGVFLSVEDRGPGIPESEQARVFERFYRLDKARNQTGGHSGLGLAIARNIAQRHGGRLVVSNVEPTGARFTLHLPAAG